MAERKAISKKTRFEVFKRDSFRCQYCGRSAPDVILEVDHIKPVAEGGKNTLLNLVTSCRDCNRGKGKRELSNHTEVSRQKNILDDLNEKRLQVEMMIQWKTELEALSEKQLLFIWDTVTGEYAYMLQGSYKRRLKELVNEFGFDIVHTAAGIAEIQYYTVQERMQKLGGICYNIRKKRDEDGD